MKATISSLPEGVHTRESVRAQFCDDNQIFVKEVQEALELRRLQYGEVPISNEMMIRQENDIMNCFFESDTIRASSANAYLNWHDSEALLLFGKASIKESFARHAYANASKQSALRDVEDGQKDWLTEWVLRIYCDELVVNALNQIHRASMKNDIILDKLKFSFDSNRAKAILKADKKAIKKAWPKSNINIMKESIMKAHMRRSSMSLNNEMFHYIASDDEEDSSSDYEDKDIA